jgi:hypothetical protein
MVLNIDLAISHLDDEIDKMISELESCYRDDRFRFFLGSAVYLIYIEKK